MKAINLIVVLCAALLAGCSPEIVQVPQTSVNTEEVEGLKQVASQHWKQVRRGRGETVLTHLNAMENAIQRSNGGVSYTDIGTSAAQVYDKRIEAHTYLAKLYLRAARSSKGSASQSLRLMEHHREKANLSYVEIGTSPEDVIALSKKKDTLFK